MRSGLPWLTSLVPGCWCSAGGCTQHSQAWDDAWAQCQAEAIEQLETAEVDADQRSEWLENYSQECMSKKGFEEKAVLIARPPALAGGLGPALAQPSYR